MRIPSALSNFCVALAFISGCALACRPIYRIYESECCGDDYVEMAREWIGVNNEPNLTAKGMKFWYVYSCPEGVWMAYEHENYTGTRYLYSSYSKDGLNHCSYENTGRTYRSLRIVGSTASYTDSAVTTYSEAGEDTIYLNATRNLPEGAFNYLVITGNEEIELFTTNSFTGLSICVRPNNGYIYDWADFERKNEKTNGTDLFTQLSNLTRIFGTNLFRSFTFGCREDANTLASAFRNANV